MYGLAMVVQGQILLQLGDHSQFNLTDQYDNCTSRLLHDVRKICIWCPQPGKMGENELRVGRRGGHECWIVVYDIIAHIAGQKELESSIILLELKMLDLPADWATGVECTKLEESNNIRMKLLEQDPIRECQILVSETDMINSILDYTLAVSGMAWIWHAYGTSLMIRRPEKEGYKSLTSPLTKSTALHQLHS